MPHISYSELKDWVFCAFYHKLTRVDKLSGFKGNEYTAFGSAMHSVCEKKLLEEDVGDDFFVQKLQIDPADVETHFALLKRTAKQNRVEFFRVTSGPKKTQNALKLLNKALYNIKNKRHIKNRLSCTAGYGCKFYRTEHCP